MCSCRSLCICRLVRVPFSQVKVRICEYDIIWAASSSYLYKIQSKQLLRYMMAHTGAMVPMDMLHSVFLYFHFLPGFRLSSCKLGGAARLPWRCEHLHPQGGQNRKVALLLIVQVTPAITHGYRVDVCCFERLLFRYKENGEALLLLTPAEEEPMLQQLTAKKIPIEQMRYCYFLYAAVTSWWILTLVHAIISMLNNSFKVWYVFTRIIWWRRINQEKLTSVEGKLQALCAADAELKQFAQSVRVSVDWLFVYANNRCTCTLNS